MDRVELAALKKTARSVVCVVENYTAGQLQLVVDPIENQYCENEFLDKSGWVDVPVWDDKSHHSGKWTVAPPRVIDGAPVDNGSQQVTGHTSASFGCVPHGAMYGVGAVIYYRVVNRARLTKPPTDGIQVDTSKNHGVASSLANLAGAAARYEVLDNEDDDNDVLSEHSSVEDEIIEQSAKLPQIGLLSRSGDVTSGSVTYLRLAFQKLLVGSNTFEFVSSDGSKFACRLLTFESSNNTQLLCQVIDQRHTPPLLLSDALHVDNDWVTHMRKSAISVLVELENQTDHDLLMLEDLRVAEHGARFIHYPPLVLAAHSSAQFGVTCSVGNVRAEFCVYYCIHDVSKPGVRSMLSGPLSEDGDTITIFVSKPLLGAPFCKFTNAKKLELSSSCSGRMNSGTVRVQIKPRHEPAPLIQPSPDEIDSNKTTLKRMDERGVLVEGYLEKSNKYGWDRRYFILHMPSRQLQYYVVSGGERTLRGWIDLCVVTGIQPRRADHTIPEFVVMTPLRKYVLKASSTKSVFEWMNFLWIGVRAVPPSLRMRSVTRSNATKGLRMGQIRRNMGWKPRFPVVIIPGFASSVLAVEESALESKWQGSTLYLSLAMLGGSLFSSFFSTAKAGKADDVGRNEDADEDEDAGDKILDAFCLHTSVKKRWVQHMMLGSDGFTDPEGIRVRPLCGIEGCDYLCRSTRQSTEASYVFGPIISNLCDIGYETGKNLIAAPYDWRIPPHIMESRDKYFTKLQAAIEKVFKHTHRRVLLLSHSLGGRVAHYFLGWIEKKQPGWIKTHVELFLPMGSPWLGASKTVRTLLNGDTMGLDLFLKHKEGMAMGRTWGSVPWLFPISSHKKRSSKPESLIDNSLLFVSNGDTAKATSIKSLLSMTQSPTTWQMFLKFYAHNNLLFDLSKRKRSRRADDDTESSTSSFEGDTSQLASEYETDADDDDVSEEMEYQSASDVDPADSPKHSERLSDRSEAPRRHRRQRSFASEGSDRSDASTSRARRRAAKVEPSHTAPRPGVDPVYVDRPFSRHPVLNPPPCKVLAVFGTDVDTECGFVFRDRAGTLGGLPYAVVDRNIRRDKCEGFEPKPLDLGDFMPSDQLSDNESGEATPTAQESDSMRRRRSSSRRRSTRADASSSASVSQRSTLEPTAATSSSRRSRTPSRQGSPKLGRHRKVESSRSPARKLSGSDNGVIIDRLRRRSSGSYGPRRASSPRSTSERSASSQVWLRRSQDVVASRRAYDRAHRVSITVDAPPPSTSSASSTHRDAMKAAAAAVDDLTNSDDASVLPPASSDDQLQRTNTKIALLPMSVVPIAKDALTNANASSDDGKSSSGAPELQTIDDANPGAELQNIDQVNETASNISESASNTHNHHHQHQHHHHEQDDDSASKAYMLQLDPGLETPTSAERRDSPDSPASPVDASTLSRDEADKNAEEQGDVGLKVKEKLDDAAAAVDEGVEKAAEAALPDKETDVVTGGASADDSSNDKKPTKMQKEEAAVTTVDDADKHAAPAAQSKADGGGDDRVRRTDTLVRVPSDETADGDATRPKRTKTLTRLPQLMLQTNGAELFETLSNAAEDDGDDDSQFEDSDGPATLQGRRHRRRANAMAGRSARRRHRDHRHRHTDRDRVGMRMHKGVWLDPKGDGTVTCASLSLPLAWQKHYGSEHIQHREIPGALHREMLCDARVLDIVLAAACGHTDALSDKHPTQSLRASFQQKQQENSQQQSK